MKPKTLSELEVMIEELFPGASVETDNQGQIVIYTGLIESSDGSLRELTNSDLGIEEDE